MKTFDGIVEEVYNDTGFRGEFMVFAKLVNAINMADQQVMGVGLPSYTGTSRFVGYYEIREASVLQWPQLDSPEVQKRKRGLALLFSALCRCLSLKYKLSEQDARTLVMDVADRYRSAEKPD
ncbi:MAG: hypothetical protein H7Z72_04285 [Bacteroidetes bacterium]|nr:hypothetical protein [Fibrella sp.]